MAKVGVRQPPVGARDLLPLAVAQKQWVEERLQGVFRRWGYHRIITPTLERLETLTAGGAVQPSAVMQLRDRQGDVLGLRPELTASIARAAATRMADSALPQRLFYSANVFRETRQGHEFFQTGVELLGAAGWLADIEVMLVMADCMNALPLPGWTLILGEVGLTESILDTIAPSARASVRKALVQLDRVYLETADLSERDRQCALQLFDLRGTPERVLSQLKALPLSLHQGRVRHLRQVCDILSDRGLSVVLDLSLIQPFAYYTGVVFEATCEGERLGLGGRYDNLFSLYSPDRLQRPGIGFSLTLETLLRLMQVSGSLPTQLVEATHLLVPLESAAVPAVLELAARWRHVSDDRESKRVEIELRGPFDCGAAERSTEEITTTARSRGIDEIVWVQADGTFHATSAQLPEGVTIS
ncbi:MAG: ATP phosphoribosyltransferase regulatory subunit [Cyanobacteria bacterium P01_E01_bin.48]